VVAQCRQVRRSRYELHEQRELLRRPSYWRAANVSTSRHPVGVVDMIWNSPSSRTAVRDTVSPAGRIQPLPLARQRANTCAGSTSDD
jgi:hypothetical protein